MSTPTATAKRFSARDLALIAVFAGIIAALGLIPAFYTPFSPVPITAQSLGILLAGAILGGRRGAAAVTLFVALVAIGLPLLAGGRGGIGVFASPTVGFILGYIVVAGLVGWLTYRVGAPYSLWKGLVINLFGSLIVMYIFGIAGMLLITQMSLTAAIVAMAPFLIGDTLKSIIAALVAKGVHTAYPALLPSHQVATPAPVSELDPVKA